jgi:hypothetical protein
MIGVLLANTSHASYISGNFGFRLSFFGISLLSTIFIYFVQIFPEEKHLPRTINILFIGLLVIIGSLSISTNLIADEITYLNGAIVDKRYGPLYPFFSLLLLSSLALSIFFSAFKYKSLENAIKKQQAKYFLTGIFLSFMFTISTNLISPLFKLGSYKIPQYGPFGFIFFIVFSAFAILKYRLFDIKVIMTEILVVIMGMVLLFFPFLMPTNTHRVLAVIVFLAFCLIGYLLVRANLKEVKNSELLENKVKERTAELSKAYEELKIRQEEIERWYSLTIGRELRMAELKQKIKEIEKK